MRNYRLIILTLIACAGFAEPAHADDRQSETVPEVNVFLRLSDRFRFFGAASLTQSLSEGPTDGELGAYLDILTLRPIFQEDLIDADWARNRYLWGRIGYAIGGIHEGLDLDQGYSEKRFVLELSARYPLSSEFFAVSRVRWDARTLDGERSDRYRFRLGLEKEFTVLNRPVVPYVNAEFFYDSRFDAWSRQVYQVGVEIALTRFGQHFRIEPYYAFQIDTGTSPTHLDRVGFVLKYYR